MTSPLNSISTNTEPTVSTLDSSSSRKNIIRTPMRFPCVALLGFNTIGSTPFLASYIIVGCSSGERNPIFIDEFFLSSTLVNPLLLSLKLQYSGSVSFSFEIIQLLTNKSISNSPGSKDIFLISFHPYTAR